MRSFRNLLSGIFARTVSSVIPVKSLRKSVRASLSKTKKGHTHSPYMINDHYGKIYYPHYSKAAWQDPSSYEIYNKDGTPLKTFFLRDVNHSNCPCNHRSKYFIFDRFNFGLDVHFYTHSSMLETMGAPHYRYGMYLEPESLVPDDYKIFDNNKGLEKDFDLIFTFTERFLEKFDNARFFSPCAHYWYEPSEENLTIEDIIAAKTKNVSIVSSEKTMCDLHKFRLDLARKCRAYGLADAFGTFDGGNYIAIEDTLKNYRFSVAIENNIEPFWFTEKILNCFASMTIPIYLGATKIDKFFNPDGIIKIDTHSDIEKILKNCTAEEYLSRLEAVKDNYNRVLAYKNPLDTLYQQYIKPDIEA